MLATQLHMAELSDCQTIRSGDGYCGEYSPANLCSSKCSYRTSKNPHLREKNVLILPTRQTIHLTPRGTLFPFVILPSSFRREFSAQRKVCNQNGPRRHFLFLRIFRRIRRAPEKPRRRRAVRPPFFAEREQFLRLRHLAFFVSDAKSAAHAKIIRRQNIVPAQLENQKHLHRPAPDAANFRQPRDNFVVGQFHDLAAKSESRRTMFFPRCRGWL